MEEYLKNSLGVHSLSRFESRGGGTTSICKSYETEKGKYFTKLNTKREARRMFEGELASLNSISATEAVRCPRPIQILDYSPDGAEPGAIFVLDHIDLVNLRKHGAELGERVARMHLHNSELKLREEKMAKWVGGPKHIGDDDETSTLNSDERYVNQFGFHTTTCCGYLPLENSWNDDWVTFYVQQRLKPRLDLIEREYGDRELLALWPLLIREVPRISNGLGDVTPALLHGDLHRSNMAETDAEPVIFDPASFYGHDEMELALANEFNLEFNSEFLPAYHRVIPKAPGFEIRQKFYKLFYFMNHWNHLGPVCREGLISLLHELIGNK